MNPIPFRLLVAFCSVLLARYVVMHSQKQDVHRPEPVQVWHHVIQDHIHPPGPSHWIMMPDSQLYLVPGPNSLQYPLQRRDQGDTLANPDTIGTVSGSKNRLSAIRLGGGCGGLGLT